MTLRVNFTKTEGGMSVEQSLVRGLCIQQIVLQKMEDLMRILKIGLGEVVF